MTGPLRLVAFGELLLRLEPPESRRLVQAHSLDVRFTGAEANVAASLSGFGMPTAVVSAVPSGAIGDACLAYIRQFGVDTVYVVRPPGRMGLFYSEQGGPGRPAQIIYDRSGSAFAVCDPAAYDWPTILGGHTWLHISGTAPALGPAVNRALQEALTVTAEQGSSVSLDLNFRRSLWDSAAAGRALRPLLQHVDVLLGSGEDAAEILGLSVPGGPAGRTGLSPAEQTTLATRLRDTYGLKHVAGIIRSEDDRGAQLQQGVLVDADGVHLSATYPVLDRVGRIGTGDAFAAGILRGLFLGESAQRTVEFAAAATHLKQSIQGDVNVVTEDEVNRVVEGSASDRVRR